MMRYIVNCRRMKYTTFVGMLGLFVLGLAACVWQGSSKSGASLKDVPNSSLTPADQAIAVPNEISCEARGVWVSPGAFYGYYCDDPQGTNCWPLARGDAKVIARINALLDQLEKAHLNTIFVPSPKMGENCGWVNRYAFEDFIALAKQRGFSLQLWVINKARSDPGCSDHSQVDFTDPQEKYRQADWVATLLARYADYFDGVHLDYIRYTDWAPVDKNKMGALQPGTDEEIGVSATVNQIHHMLREQYPRLELSAAVFPAEPAYAETGSVTSKAAWREDIPVWYQDWFAAHPGSWYDQRSDYKEVPEFMKYQQDPISWLRENAIDYVIPMNYTMDTGQWSTQSDYWKSFASYEQNNFDKIWMGLRWGKDYQASPEQVIRKIEYGRSIGLRGFAIHEFSAWDAAANGGQGDFVDDTTLIDLLSVDLPGNNFHAPFKEPLRPCPMK
jgi:uncharacterized lipoprotein YddW (UPF0748 family)